MPTGLIMPPLKLKAFDDFNRANSTNLGANWIEFTGNRSITSNALTGTGGVIWSLPCYTDNQYSEVVLSATSGPLQLLVRSSAGGWPLMILEVAPATGAWTVVTDPSSAASNHTNRTSGSMGSCSIGTRIRFQADGEVYSFSKDGGSMTTAWTDTGNSGHPLATTKRFVGVNNTGSFDEWSGGDL